MARPTSGDFVLLFRTYWERYDAAIQNYCQELEDQLKAERVSVNELSLHCQDLEARLKQAEEALKSIKVFADIAWACDEALKGLGKKVKPKLSQHRKHVQRLRECQLSISLASVADRYEELIETSNQLIMIASRWQWMCELLDVEKVSDFALSFPEVRKLDDIMRPWRDVAVLSDLQDAKGDCK